MPQAHFQVTAGIEGKKIVELGISGKQTVFRESPGEKPHLRGAPLDSSRLRRCHQWILHVCQADTGHGTDGFEVFLLPGHMISQEEGIR